MSKKTHDHKQRRELAKQRRLDIVSRKSDLELCIRVPKLCRTSTLFDLTRDFYQLTGVDIFIGIPANVQNGPQTETVKVIPGPEAFLFGAQMSQLYAVCYNATMKNACANPNYTNSSLDILLGESTESDRTKWVNFLNLVTSIRQFFCHYTYLWPGAVPDQGICKLVHYLDVCFEKTENCGQLPQWLIEQKESSWLQLQEYITQTADELYGWLENIAHTRGTEPATPDTWKGKIALLYQPTQMNDLTKKSWMAPIYWRKKKYQLGLREVGTSFNMRSLIQHLGQRIQSREAGLPPSGEGEFVFLQDQIYSWAGEELQRQYYRPSHAMQNSKGFYRK